MAIKEYIQEEQGYVLITLASPVNINGSTVNQVRMREPTAGDMKRSFSLSGSEAERELRIFSNLMEIAPEELEAFSLRNYKRLQEAFLIFTE
ncbi:MAG TPA: phage tail assembly protein [Xylella taiwanensis]